MLCLQENYRQAEPFYLEALALVRALGDERSQANITQALGDVALHVGDVARAQSLLADSLASFTAWETRLESSSA